MSISVRGSCVWHSGDKTRRHATCAQTLSAAVNADAVVVDSRKCSDEHTEAGGNVVPSDSAPVRLPKELGGIT